MGEYVTVPRQTLEDVLERIRWVYERLDGINGWPFSSPLQVRMARNDLVELRAWLQEQLIALAQDRILELQRQLLAAPVALRRWCPPEPIPDQWEARVLIIWRVGDCSPLHPIDIGEELARSGDYTLHASGWVVVDGPLGTSLGVLVVA